MRVHWFREARDLSAAAGSNDLKFGPVLEERWFKIDRLNVRNNTSTPTAALTILIKRGASEFLVDEVPAPAVSRIYRFEGPIRLWAGDTLIARFGGCTLNDRLDMWLEGQWAEGLHPPTWGAWQGE